jgi:aminopeptidase N
MQHRQTAFAIRLGQAAYKFVVCLTGFVATCAALWLPGAAAFAAEAPQTGRFSFETTPGHLSKLVRPTRYRLELDLDPQQDRFGGKVVIDLRVTQRQAAIELHAFELAATSARLVGGVSREGRLLTVVPRPDTQSWRLEPSDGLAIDPGTYRLDISYSGKVQVAGEGLYAAPYTVDGQPRRMLATQLEAIHARRVFPAFDEPAFRAAFELNVRAPQGYEVASNMPLRRRTPGSTAVLHQFAATPVMPTYLFAVVVGQFEILHARSGTLPLRLLVAPGKREQARLALRATQDVLPWYASYFGQPFALPKLDQIAVPSVRSGAMEDWGLISYAEDDMLFDPERSSEETRQNVYGSVAHEIAHQWFGNLVTAASWEEIWLNEAFATWLQTKASERFNPSWKVRLRARPWIDSAMTLDSGAATRAIRSGPVTETAVNDVFDAITYAKGGAVLSMLEAWMGPQVFRRGLAAYMKERRLSNATAADLWHHIGRASGRDVTAVAASWTDQPGFPLIEADSRCTAGRASLTLTQSRFNGQATEPAQRWKIPVQLRHGGVERSVLLQERQQSFDLGACTDTATLVNAGGQGFYRVSYDAGSWQALTGRYAGLAEADRVTLLSDSFALMQAGRQPLAAYLALLDHLPDTDLAAQSLLWPLVRRQLEFLDVALAGRPAQQQLRAIGRRLAAPVLAQLGWAARPGESTDLGELRGTLIVLLGRFGHEPTITRALHAFDADEAGTERLPATLREPVTRVAGMAADRARFDRLRERLASASGEEDRWNYLRALASGQDATRAAELLDASLAGTLPANIGSAIPAMVARHSPFGAAAYRYSVDHWSRLAELASTWGRQSLLPDAAASDVQADQARRLIDDQRRLAGADGDRAATRQAEDIRLRAAVRAREADWLEQLSIDRSQP